MTPEPDAEGDREPHPASDDFDAIVSAWRREGSVPEWPDDPRDATDVGAGAALLFQPTAAPDPTGAPTPVEPATPPEAVAEEEHFVPPEPPPLPRLGPPAIVGLVLLGLGLILTLAPSWLGVPDVYGLPLGLLGLASGLGWLVLRLWPDHSPGRDDDGAVL